MTVVDFPTRLRRGKKQIPPLENGDRLDQPTFHERYEAMPPETRAELIEGIVYMTPPIGEDHSREHGLLIIWLAWYVGGTPGLDLYPTPTVILGPDSEPEPDVVLRLPGGRTTVVRRKRTTYISGPPEFVAEAASSSESIDLNQKRDEYERSGVGEYLAFLTRTRSLAWFVRETGSFVKLKLDKDGFLKSRAFPGLWLDPAALLRGDTPGMQKALNLGLATAEHSAFVEALARKKGNGRKRK
jgi:Uma2 family endonuclease